MTEAITTVPDIPRPVVSALTCHLPEIVPWRVVSDANRSSSEESLRLLWDDDGGTLSVLTIEQSLNAPTFVVRFNRIAQFELLFESRDVLISSLGNVSESTIQHLLVDQIWPRIIAHCGRLVLHAAGVTSPDGAILFVGKSGHGKSTLAASLHQCGFALLGDDAMVISGGDSELRCSAVYRSLRLFPDSIAVILQQPVLQSAVADYTDKRNVHLPMPERHGDDHRIKAIFFLNPDKDHASASVEAVGPGDACMRLVEHSFWLDPTDLALTEQKLRLASMLVNGVPTYQLDYPREYSKLAEVHAAILSVLA